MENERFPAHVAIILDGNGRWAKRRGLPRQMGHKAGCENLEKMVRVASDLGIRWFTVYGFSTENWTRSNDEVGSLMQLFRHYLKRLLRMAKANNVRVLAIGDLSRFAPDIVSGFLNMEEETKDNTGMTFVLAINYGARDEILRGVKKAMQAAREGTLTPEDLTAERFADLLDTRGIPDPDLVIRTSGEERLSNFLLWQSAYAELYFTDVLWPDFHQEELEEAIRQYAARDRRYGGRKG